MMNEKRLPGWLQRVFAKLQQQALDKLPEDDMAMGGPIPGLNPEPAAPPVDPAMMLPPEEPKPKVENNTFRVDINGVNMYVKLVPELVMEEGGEAPVADPMAQFSDTSTNPGADPQALAQWYTDQGNEKPFSNSSQGTEDPLSQEEQGIAVHDTGDEKALAQQSPDAAVQKKKRQTAAIDLTANAGYDHSNPYPPCKYCFNYVVETGDCRAEIDPLKAQAAGHCSFLNSELTPFLDKPGAVHTPGNNPEQSNSSSNEIQSTPGAGGSGSVSRAASPNDNNNIKNIWRKT